MQHINDDIRQGQFKQIYLLYGEERYLKRQYTERLKKALCGDGDEMNTHYYEGKNIPVGEVIDLAETLPFLSERRVIIISDSGLFKSGGEKMAEYLAAPNETTYFVFTESEIDKRSRLFKTVQKNGYAAEFGVQDEKTLIRWITSILKRENKKSSENTLKLFLNKTGTDMDNIYMELEKLICYCIDKDIIEPDDVEAICTERITNRIFDMVSAIADKNTKKALDLYYDLITLKEPPMRILFLIARQCNMLLQVKEMRNRGFDNKAIASSIGVPPFVVGKYLAQAERFDARSLKKAVGTCVDAEESVKSGKMNDVLSVELLIMSVF